MPNQLIPFDHSENAGSGSKSSTPRPKVTSPSKISAKPIASPNLLFICGGAG
jgi:hypothetical protein